MIALFQMWMVVEGLGLICLPLTLIVFRNLPDRGWAFSKAIGTLLLAFGVWIPLMIFHSFVFNQTFILTVASALLVCNLLALRSTIQTIKKMLCSNIFYIMSVECIFLGMIFLLGAVRSQGPEIHQFEMFMDEGFIASILRSTHFPPSDMWFSGGSINYYYYAHYTIAVLAKLLGQRPSIAFNTGICLFFGLCAVNLFGIVCNIVAWARYHCINKDHLDISHVEAQHDDVIPSLLPALPYGIFSFLLALIFGNLAATRAWWINHDKAYPDWHSLWFGASRVVGPPTTINEFPAFSFLLSCFHAHVLTLAFTILVIALAFNLFLQTNGKGLFAFGRGWRLLIALGVNALVLGGLFTMNGWDYPTYMGLTLLCLVLQQWLVHQKHLSVSFLFHLLLAGGSLVVLSLVLYLPFYLNFVSPSQGFALVDPKLRSTVSDELMIYSLFAFVFLSFLLTSCISRSRSERALHPTRIAFVSKDEQVELSSPASSLLSPSRNGVFSTFSPDMVYDRVAPVQASTAVAVVANEIVSSRVSKKQRALLSLSPRALLLPGVSLIYLLFCLVLLYTVPKIATFVAGSSLALVAAVIACFHLRFRAQAFALILGLLAFLLVAFCEVFYLKDIFSDSSYQRMNTIFKFYFQAWVLLSVSCAAGLFFIRQGFRTWKTRSIQARWMKRMLVGIWYSILLLLSLASMVYPIFAPSERYMYTSRPSSYLPTKDAMNLDGLAYMRTCNVPVCDYATSGDYAAIIWMNEHIQGQPVIVEAVGDDYSSFARVSTFTGLPTIMGWIGHEYQWRVMWLKDPVHNIGYQQRASDVKQIYVNPDVNVVFTLMQKYHAQYLYFGPLERAKYTQANTQRFDIFMQIVYRSNGVTIYKVK